MKTLNKFVPVMSPLRLSIVKFGCNTCDLEHCIGEIMALTKSHGSGSPTYKKSDAVFGTCTAVRSST